MKKDELKDLLALVSEYYPDTKIKNPSAMLEAWYEVLKEYTCEETKKAMLKVVLSDTRDYPAFPHIGKVVQEIAKERDRINSLYKF